MKKIVLEGYGMNVLAVDMPPQPGSGQIAPQKLKILEFTAPDGHEQIAVPIPQDIAKQIGDKLSQSVETFATLPGDIPKPPQGPPPGGGLPKL